MLGHYGDAFSHDIQVLFESNQLGFYVYTRRNVLDWYSSFVKRWVPWMGDDREFAAASFDLWNLANSLASYYSKVYPSKFKIVEYEELLQRPEATLTDIARFSGLAGTGQIDPTPTYMGQMVKANSSFDEKNVKGGVKTYQRGGAKLYH